MNIGLIGNGAIARLISGFCEARADRYTVVGAIARSTAVASVGRHGLVKDWPALRALKPDLVIECADHGAVATYGPQILRDGVDIAIASTGALAHEEVLAEIRAAAIAGKARAKLPAGAAPGIDTLAAANIAGLDSVVLTTRKPPKAWAGSIAEASCRLDEVIKPTVIFEGDARAAAVAFPKNANVAATTALAGVGFERTWIRLVADPTIEANMHRIDASGAAGVLTLEVAAEPCPDNPKTSYLAALSIMRLLQNETAGILI